MSEIQYKVGGPLLFPNNGSVYVERPGDKLAYQHLQNMDYISLIEPRQQGKTSLINRLIHTFADQNYVFVNIDMASTDSSSESGWYESIYKWLKRQFHSNEALAIDDQITIPVNAGTWLHFLMDIAERAQQADLRVIFVLDEVGATPQTWATDFFSVIRSIYIQQQSIPSLKCISFIVAGAFNPRTLITNPNVSNFNISQRIELRDFTLEEVKQLIKPLRLTTTQTKSLTGHIHDWVNGQPYLTQFLCHFISHQKITKATVSMADLANKAVEQFFRFDRNHVISIIDALKRTGPTTQRYIERIRSGYNPVFVPAQNHIQAELELLGIIKEATDGTCIIRNRLYKQIIANMSTATPTDEQQDHMGPEQSAKKDVHSLTQQAESPIEIFISYAHADGDMRDKLVMHLSPLKRRGQIVIWHDKGILGGKEWQDEINSHLYSAQIILLLISAHFIHSEYCYNIEMKLALERNSRREALVIPIILSAVKWENAPFSKLQALPGGGKAITSWANENDAFYDVVTTIQKTVDDLLRNAAI